MTGTCCGGGGFVGPVTLVVDGFAGWGAGCEMGEEKGEEEGEVVDGEHASDGDG